MHLDNLKAPPKPLRKTGPVKDDSDASTVDVTAHKPEPPPAFTGQDKSTPTFNDDKQGLPNPDSSQRERSSFNHEKEPSMTEAPQNIPQSMQGFDKYDLLPAPPIDDQEKISPHKRIPPIAPSIPLSMQEQNDIKPDAKEEKAIRRREKVHIRQTSQGWVEFDKKKEDESEKSKEEVDTAASVQPEDISISEENKSEDTVDVSESRQQNPEQVPKASTQASWQAFASSEASSNIEVSVPAT